MAVVLALLLGGAELLAASSPAFAGALTASTFTASTPYTYTGAGNAAYNWGFTTAGTSTLSRVAMTVPTGTGGANRYLVATGTTNGNFASTADSTNNSITGDIDIRVKAAMANWNPPGGSYPDLMAKVNSKFSYHFYVAPGGYLDLQTSANGTSWATTANSGAAPTVANGAALWVRVTLSVNNGASGNTATFYTSPDGIAWTPLGTPFVTSGTTSIYDSNDALEVGSSYGGYGGLASSKIYYAEIRNGINGTVANRFDPNQSTPGSSSWVSNSGETWTVTRSGSNLPDDIATDLTASNITGLPQGGTANYRMIDGMAYYYFAPVSVSASTPCTLSLQGFTNAPTAGSYTSTITTYDNSTPPAAVDSATTTALAFTTDSASSTDSVTIDPSFTFSVANQPAACNGESNFVGAAGSPTAIALGHLAAGNNTSGGQALTISSNAGSGFSLFIKGTQTTQNLRSSSHNWTDVPGSYTTPAPLGSGERFGYTYHDATASTSVTNPSAATFAALTNTGQLVMGSPTSGSGTGCISFDAQASAATPAGSYAAVVIYLAVPTF